MTSMTPQRPSKKGRLSSPLGEMDDGLEELEGTAAETPVQLTPTALADIVRQEIQRGLDPLDAKITTLQSTVEGRLDSVEAELLSHHSKIEKMQKLLDSLDGATPRSCASDKSLKFEQQLAEQQTQVEQLRVGTSMPTAGASNTMVVGGLAGLGDDRKATDWISDTLNRLQGPKHIGTYIKSTSFAGILFVKFRSVDERDYAVGLLSTSLKIGEASVWATRDLPVPVRARKVFLMRLRWQLSRWGFEKGDFVIDDQYTIMTVTAR